MDKKKLIIVVGAGLALCAVGTVIYAAIWALKTKLYKALAPYLGMIDSVLAALSAHPVAWIALIASAIGAAIGGYVLYKVIQHVRARALEKANMEKANKYYAEEKEPVPYKEEELSSMDPLQDDSGASQTVEEARAAKYAESASDVSVVERERFKTTYAKLETLSKGLKSLDEMKPTSEEDAKEIEDMRKGLVEEMKGHISVMGEMSHEFLMFHAVP